MRLNWFTRGASKNISTEVPADNERDLTEPCVPQQVFEFYERAYWFELDTREKIVARLQVPIGILLALFGAQAYMLLGADLTKSTWIYSCFLLILLIAFCFCARSAQLMFQVMSGHIYRFIPTLQEFERYRLSCYAKFRCVEGADQWMEHWVETSFRTELCEKIVGSTSYNAVINEDRSTRAWRAHTLLLWSGILTVLAFCIFFLGNLREVPIHKIELVSSERTKSDVVFFRPVTLTDVLRLQNKNP